jgi:glucose-6-phosphate 1-dehydrogenase
VVQTQGDARLFERARVILEKPFGTDLPSARRLNTLVQEMFDEDQVYRVDHFFGREAAQKPQAFRFANVLFEPIWNRQPIDHLEIDVPASLGIDSRGPFNEQTEAFRHMVVTHLFQIWPLWPRSPDRHGAPCHQRGEQGVPLTAANRSVPGGPGPVRGILLGAKGWRPTLTPRP